MDRQSRRTGRVDFGEMTFGGAVTRELPRRRRSLDVTEFDELDFYVDLVWRWYRAKQYVEGGRVELDISRPAGSSSIDC